jgi:hypothetical protein
MKKCDASNIEIISCIERPRPQWLSEYRLLFVLSFELHPLTRIASFAFSSGLFSSMTIPCLVEDLINTCYQQNANFIRHLAPRR